MRVRAGLTIITLGFGVASARGDDASLPAAEPSPRTVFAARVSGAIGRPLKIFGGVHDSGRGTAGVQIEVRRTLARSEARLLEAVFAVVPAEPEWGTPIASGSSASTGSLRRHTVYGGGVNPLGLSMRFGNGGWRPFLEGDGGLRMFVDRVPIPRGTRFNFVADVGAGVYRRLSPRYAMSIALDLHHVSNGNTGEKNPGVNYVLLNLGLWPTRGRS